MSCGEKGSSGSIDLMSGKPAGKAESDRSSAVRFFDMSPFKQRILSALILATNNLQSHYERDSGFLSE